MRFLSTLVASTLGTLIALGVVVLFLFFFFFAVMLSSDQTPRVESGSVLTLELSGPVPETVADDPFARAFTDAPRYSLRDLKEALDKAAADDRIAGVWLQFKGLSASWATLEEIRTALLRFKESGKPLLASSDDYTMAEDEYFLASTADSVFAAPEAIFEFNGFYITTPFFRNALDELNIEPQVVRAGQYKSAVEPFTREDLSPENEEQLAELLQAQNQHFMQGVAESRNTQADSLERLSAEAAILTASDAHTAGLLDGLLYRDEVADLWRERLGGYDEDESLRVTEIGNYVRVPASEAGLETGHDGEVAIVYAEGQIVSGESETDPFGGSTTLGAETFNQAMRTVRRTDRIDAVVVRINSPGGSAAASDAMWREIKLTADEKPVIVSMGDVAASGGYWMATAGDTIMADPLTITGSIGVFGLFFDTGGFFNEKLGITFDGVRTSPYADLFSGLRPLSNEERQLLEQFIEDTYETFLERVAESQDLSVDEVDAIAQGRVWAGQQALDIGLVDALGGLEDALQAAASAAGLEEGAYQVSTYPRRKTFVEQFTEALTARAGEAWLKLRTSPAERLLLEQHRFLKQLAREHGTAQARLPFEIRIE